MEESRVSAYHLHTESALTENDGFPWYCFSIEKYGRLFIVVIIAYINLTREKREHRGLMSVLSSLKTTVKTHRLPDTWTLNMLITVCKFCSSSGILLKSYCHSWSTLGDYLGMFVTLHAAGCGNLSAARPYRGTCCVHISFVYRL